MGASFTVAANGGVGVGVGGMGDGVTVFCGLGVIVGMETAVSATTSPSSAGVLLPQAANNKTNTNIHNCLLYKVNIMSKLYPRPFLVQCALNLRFSYVPVCHSRLQYRNGYDEPIDTKINGRS